MPAVSVRDLSAYVRGPERATKLDVKPPPRREFFLIWFSLSCHGFHFNCGLRGHSNHNIQAQVLPSNGWVILVSSTLNWPLLARLRLRALPYIVGNHLQDHVLNFFMYPRCTRCTTSLSVPVIPQHSTQISPISNTRWRADRTFAHQAVLLYICIHKVMFEWFFPSRLRWWHLCVYIDISVFKNN